MVNPAYTGLVVARSGVGGLIPRSGRPVVTGSNVGLDQGASAATAMAPAPVTFSLRHSLRQGPSRN